LIFEKLSSSLEISLKQNEADLIMAKKNADVAKSNLEKLQNDLENEKNISNSLRTQVNFHILYIKFTLNVSILYS
jgi:hypothetical protein